MAYQPVNQPVQNTVASGLADGVIFASASRAAAAYNSNPYTNAFCRGVRLFITNDNAGGSTATAKIQVRSPQGSFTDLAGAVTAALGSVTGSTLTVYPGITASANVYVDGIIGLTWRVVLTIGTATGTSKVEAEYLL